MPSNYQEDEEDKLLAKRFSAYAKRLVPALALVSAIGMTYLMHDLKKEVRKIVCAETDCTELNAAHPVTPLSTLKLAAASPFLLASAGGGGALGLALSIVAARISVRKNGSGRSTGATVNSKNFVYGGTTRH